MRLPQALRLDSGKGAAQAPFFVPVAFVLLLAFGPSFAAADPHSNESAPWPTPSSGIQKPDGRCIHPANHETVTLKRVTDGDTLVLSDDRRVRIIGINTPELGRNKQHAELYASEAKLAVQQFLSNSKTLKLIPGIDPFDRHSRTLAHIQRSDGAGIAEHLLAQGLAAHIVVSPNSRCAEAFAKLEAQAKRSGIGLWEQTSDWQIEAKRLRHIHRGFRIVRGSVVAIEHTENAHVIDLDKGMKIHVSKALAAKLPIHSLLNRRVEIRGWLQQHQGSLKVNLHHALNLSILH